MRKVFLFLFLLCAFPVFGDWLNTDVPEGLTPPGSATPDDGTWTIKAAGGDIWGQSDEFHFLYDENPVGDDFAISCHLVSMGGDTPDMEAPDPWAKAGLMARLPNPRWEGPGDVDRPTFIGPEENIYLCVSRDNRTKMQQRSTFNTGTGNCDTNNRLWWGVHDDVWLKLIRIENTYYSYASTNPPIWRLVDTYTVDLIDPTFVGLAVTSHSSGNIATCVFDNINLEDAGISVDGPTDLSCQSTGEGVTVQWANNATYDDIQVFRQDLEGNIEEVKPDDIASDAEEVTDDPPDGAWTYHVVSFKGEAPCVAKSCQTLVGSAGIVSPEGFIQSWLLLGPYDQSGGTAPGEGQIVADYLTDGEITEYNFLPHEGDEVETVFFDIAASTGYLEGFAPGAFAVPTVQAHVDSDDTIDFNSLAVEGNNDQVMAYAFAYVNNPGEEPVDGTLQIASDDSIQVSLGPCPTFVHNIPRGYGGAGTIQDTAPVTIEPGPHRLMVKVFEGGGGWGFRLRFADSAGNPLTPDSDPPLEVGLNPEAFGLTEIPQADCPFASITIDPATPACGQAPLEVTFDGIESTAQSEIVEYEWDFGDGTTDTDVSVTHSFEDAGIYTVTLTIKTETDATDSTTTKVTSYIKEDEFICEPPSPEPEATLVSAFAFGADTLTCPTYNDPDVDYTKVSQNALGMTGIEYDPGRGWGYELTRPGDDSHGGWGIYGPFDDSANNRGEFSASCPEALYNSFIGAKNFTNTCGSAPCPSVEGTTSPEGIHFRVDVPDGLYRFVAAVGDADNCHSHTIIVENGGEGEQINMEESVVLVDNFDQNDWCIGEIAGDDLGDAVYARVGFNCRIPPLGDGIAPDPVFVSMDENGQPTFDPPNSPQLEVDAGYIRLHQLQGRASPGPGGGDDPNGGDMVIFEAWEVSEVSGVNVRMGDVNSDTKVDVSDAIFILNYMFAGGAQPTCVKAGDVNDDDKLDISDAVKLLGVVFTGEDMVAPDGSLITPADPRECVAYPASDVPDFTQPEALPGCGEPCTPAK